MTIQKDINDRPINPGDWIAQAYSLGRCPALKISKVVGYNDNGKIKVMGFERHERWYDADHDRLVTPIITWERSKSAYALAFSERMAVIDQIAPSLQAHIEEVYGGDPLAKVPTEV